MEEGKTEIFQKNEDGKNRVLTERDTDISQNKDDQLFINDFGILCRKVKLCQPFVVFVVSILCEN